MTRLTEEEYQRFCGRVEMSGLAQGAYIRQMILSGQITVQEHSDLVVAALDELMMLRVALDRQGGLLKYIIRPNEERRTLRPEEWEQLMSAIKDIGAMRRRISGLEVMLGGDHQTCVGP